MAGYRRQNTDGPNSEDKGMNALMLMLHCEKEGYTIPRFCTFDCVQRLNLSLIHI